MSEGSETTPANTTVKKEALLPLRQILTYPVIISIVNYSSLAFLDIMLNALLPLFFAMPIGIGGLGFAPLTIGYIFGAYGAATGAFNAFCFVKIVRQFGEKRAFFGGISLFLPLFILMPIMNMCARAWGVGSLVWILVSMEILLMVVMDMSYGLLLTPFLSLVRILISYLLRFRMYIHLHHRLCTKQTVTRGYERSISDDGLNVSRDWPSLVDFVILVLSAA